MARPRKKSAEDLSPRDLMLHQLGEVVAQLRAISEVVGVPPEVLAFSATSEVLAEALLLSQYLRDGDFEALHRLIATQVPKSPRK